MLVLVYGIFFFLYNLYYVIFLDYNRGVKYCENLTVRQFPSMRDILLFPTVFLVPKRIGFQLTYL